MPANFENSAVATRLEKVSFHSNPKERQCQRMLKHNCTHLTCQQSNAQNSPRKVSTVRELRIIRCSSRFRKDRGTRVQIANIHQIIEKWSLVSLIFLKRSLVFPILLFSSISLHWSLRKAFLSLLAFLWNSAFRWIYLSFSLLPFTSLLFSAFIRPPQTTVLPFCISFSWGWSRSQPPVQCYKPLSIVLQAFCLSDLVPWIYLSLPLCNHMGFDLGHTWMV